MGPADCIFCLIASGSAPAKKVYEDDKIVAFHDIHSKAPVHVLVIPKKHVATLTEYLPEDADLLGKMMLLLPQIAKTLGITARGYKVVINTGKEAGQVVFHFHIHLLGGGTIEEV